MYVHAFTGDVLHRDLLYDLRRTQVKGQRLIGCNQQGGGVVGCVCVCAEDTRGVKCAFLRNRVSLCVWVCVCVCVR